MAEWLLLQWSCRCTFSDAVAIPTWVIIELDQARNRNIDRFSIPKLVWQLWEIPATFSWTFVGPDTCLDGRVFLLFPVSFPQDPPLRSIRLLPWRICTEVEFWIVQLPWHSWSFQFHHSKDWCTGQYLLAIWLVDGYRFWIELNGAGKKGQGG